VKHPIFTVGVRVFPKFLVGLFGFLNFWVFGIHSRNCPQNIYTRYFGYPEIRVRVWVFPINPSGRSSAENHRHLSTSRFGHKEDDAKRSAKPVATGGRRSCSLLRYFTREATVRRGAIHGGVVAVGGRRPPDAALSLAGYGGGGRPDRQSAASAGSPQTSVESTR
jgi:hypothetical protein